jgi:hypothetical protein
MLQCARWISVTPYGIIGASQGSCREEGMAMRTLIRSTAVTALALLGMAAVVVA